MPSQEEHLAQIHVIDNFTTLTASFVDSAELRASKWASYLERVYAIDTLTFPFSLANIQYFYSALLPEDEVISLPLLQFGNVLLFPNLKLPNHFQLFVLGFLL